MATSVHESLRTERLTRVMALAIDTLGTSEKAASWLHRSNRALDNQVPLDMLETDTGMQQVETILGRIDWGLYS